MAEPLVEAFAAKYPGPDNQPPWMMMSVSHVLIRICVGLWSPSARTAPLVQEWQEGLTSATSGCSGAAGS